MDDTTKALDGDELELRAVLTKHGIAQSTVDELKAKFPKLYVLYDAPIIIRPASGAQMDTLARKTEKERPAHAKDLASWLVVHPAGVQYQQMLEEWPLIWSTIIGAATDIARNKPVTEAKKL